MNSSKAAKKEVANLFSGLFPFRPHHDRTAKENFLTEAFAYILRTDRGALNAWLSKVMRESVAAQSCEVATFDTHIHEEHGTNIYPDMCLRAKITQRRSIVIYSEHKWNAPFSKEQMDKYHGLTKGKNARLVFIGATHGQVKRASDMAKRRSSLSAFSWSEVSDAFRTVRPRSKILSEFINFLDEQGLGSSQPIPIRGMQNADREVLLSTLATYSNKLRNEFDWRKVPARYHAGTAVRRSYGRIGIHFWTPDWMPALTLGFLHDPTDHKVSLVNQKGGVDLMLRIEAQPSDTEHVEPVELVIRERRREIEKYAHSVLVKGEAGNGNGYSVVIIQESLLKVLDGAKNETDQLRAIYKRLIKWLELVFDDGLMEKALKRVGLNSR